MQSWAFTVILAQFIPSFFSHFFSFWQLYFSYLFVGFYVWCFWGG